LAELAAGEADEDQAEIVYGKVEDVGHAGIVLFMLVGPDWRFVTGSAAE
jgi:hypothetical protein